MFDRVPLPEFGQGASFDLDLRQGAWPAVEQQRAVAAEEDPQLADLAQVVVGSVAAMRSSCSAVTWATKIGALAPALGWRVAGTEP